MKVLDLCSGLGGWSEAFLHRGHEVVRIDNDPRFTDVPHTYIKDVVTNHLELEPADVVLASPPCQGFSVASIGRMWTSPGVPKHKTAIQGTLILRAVLRAIRDLSPTFWWLENPRGMMRKMPEMLQLPRTTVTYCQYGGARMKPTDLWGSWPETWAPRPPCQNGAPCHTRASRGSPTGTQGIKGSALRAVVPYELSLEVCLACEATGLR